MKWNIQICFKWLSFNIELFCLSMMGSQSLFYLGRIVSECLKFLRSSYPGSGCEQSKGRKNARNVSLSSCYRLLQEARAEDIKKAATA